MTLLRFEPMREFDTIHDQIQNYISNFTNLRMTDDFNPNMDIWEDDGKINIIAELPGVKKEDIKLTIEDNIITLEGEKKRFEQSDEKNYLRKERVCGKFKRKFTLPESIDNQKVNAEFNDGILTIELGKLEAPAKIEKEISVK